jgi:OmpA-OmpF porin, OOP family
MFYKKYLLPALVFVMLAQSLFAQESPKTDTSHGPSTSMQWSNRDMTYRGKNYDVLDSAYYPKFRRKQFHKYIDHQEIFPPKPRNQWEIGGGLGFYNVIGNVPTLMIWQQPLSALNGGGGINLNVRKSLGYIFSLRAQFIYGAAKNLDRQPTTSFDGPYTNFGYIPLQYSSPPTIKATPIYRATRTEASSASLDLMFNAYNINFHHARNAVSFFGYFGLGAVDYKAYINALDGTFTPYDFGTIVGSATKNSKVRKALQKGMDKSYESVADNGGGATLMHKTLDFAPSVGAGVQYKFNKKFNIQVENRYMFPSDGYLDGSRYGKPLGDVVSQGRRAEAINYFSFSLNYNLKTKKKSVEPLYWINPLDHAYSELSYPRHMILPNPVLPDEDGDGVTDQFDKCPKTPKGVAVDAHGCPLDTDGDGVPDYKDKQLITPTECQPVDADGVGKCPCPDACKDMNTNGKTGACGNIGAGTILFTNNSTHISTGMEAQLAVLAAQMQASPLCKVVIMGGGNGSKIKEQHSWEHVDAIITYMSDKNNISRERFIFKYGEAGDENIVTYRSANVDESGASNVPPPHPEIK